MGLQPKAYVLRVGHRPGRDKRVSTHVALAARALGASGFILAGECDPSVLSSIAKTERAWGRGFELVACGLPWQYYARACKEAGWVLVHLTMYGEPLEEVAEELRRARKPILVAVGAEKVPCELFELADYNVSVTGQPHSEVSALAIFLDRLYSGEELKRYWFEDPELVVEPSKKGKRVRRVEEKRGRGSER